MWEGLFRQNFGPAHDFKKIDPRQAHEVTELEVATT
jgi:hypothetical protein